MDALVADDSIFEAAVVAGTGVRHQQSKPVRLNLRRIRTRAEAYAKIAIRSWP